MLTPGIIYLARHLHYIVIPLATPYAVLTALRKLAGVTVPTWLVVTGWSATIALGVPLLVSWKYRQQERSAAKHGMVMPPVWHHEWPGAIDVARNIAKTSDERFLGT